MNAVKVLLIVFAMFLLSDGLFAQGCSDAGICTVHGLNTDDNDNKLLNHVRVGAVNGKEDDGTSGEDADIWGAYLEYTRELNKNFSLSGKFTYISESSPSLNNHGISDFFLSGNYVTDDGISFTAGMKFPLSDANEKFDSVDVGLPMVFQTSQGTFDLILGLGYHKKNFRIDLGYQQPLNTNDNTYLSTAFPPGAPFGAYQSTNKFERQPDILLRASYDIVASKNWIFTPSLLPIFHLGNDKFTDSSGTVQEIDGSSGVTFNLNLFIEYVLSPTNSIVLGASAPVISRDLKPDGLGRKYVINFDFRISI